MTVPVPQLLVATIGKINEGAPTPQKSLLVCGVEVTVMVALTCVKRAPTKNTNRVKYFTKAALIFNDVLGVEANLLLVIFTIFVQRQKYEDYSKKKLFQ